MRRNSVQKELNANLLENEAIGYEGDGIAFNKDPFWQQQQQQQQQLNYKQNNQTQGQLHPIEPFVEHVRTVEGSEHQILSRFDINPGSIASSDEFRSVEGGSQAFTSSGQVVAASAVSVSDAMMEQVVEEGEIAAANDGSEGIDEESGEYTNLVNIVFLKAVRRLISSSQMVRVYSVVKVLAAILVLWTTQQSCFINEYDGWVSLMLLQSFLAIIYTSKSIRLMKNVYFVENLGFDMLQINSYPVSDELPDGQLPYMQFVFTQNQNNHLNNNNNTNNNNNYFNQDVENQSNNNQAQINNNNNMVANEEEVQIHTELQNFYQIPLNQSSGVDDDPRKIQMMVMQLKYELKRRDWVTMASGYSQLILYFGLQAWAIVSFFISDEIVQNIEQGKDLCHYNEYKYIFVVVLIGFFQYLDIYIIIIVALICNGRQTTFSGSVFLIGGLVVFLIKRFKAKRDRAKFIRSLRPKKYVDDPQNPVECAICLSMLEPGDKVVTLPCQAHHVFHDECITSWLKVNQTCPLCRTRFDQLQENRNAE